MSITRTHLDYTKDFERFLIQQKVYTMQYCHMYSKRAQLLKDTLMYIMFMFYYQFQYHHYMYICIHLQLAPMRERSGEISSSSIVSLIVSLAIWAYLLAKQNVYLLELSSSNWLWDHQSSMRFVMELLHRMCIVKRS